MRTGNAILAVFSFWMAFTFPLTAIDTIKTNNLESMIPVSTGIFALCIFFFFIAAGIVSLAFGKESIINHKIVYAKQPADREISKEALRKITGDEKLTAEDIFK